MASVDVSRAPGAQRLAELRACLQQAPTLPLDQPFTAGLGPLLKGAVERTDHLSLEGGVGSVLGAIGDRFTVTVTESEVRSRGLLTTDVVRWDEVTGVRVLPMSQMAADRAFDALLTRSVPIRGLRGLVQRLLDPLTDRAAAAVGTTVTGDPDVVHALCVGDGAAIELQGPSALTALLSRGLTDVIVAMAAEREIPVTSGATCEPAQA